MNFMKKREKLEIIRQHYPGALTTIDAVNRLIDFVEMELDLEPSQVMSADSICSDDVNSIQYPARAKEFLGPFKMGGLDGFPFTGLTGMGAFTSHAPDDGAMFIYYGPHIGISSEGELGSILRHGHSTRTGCCGAARAALGRLERGEIVPGQLKELDYQMNTLEQILLKQKDRILGAPNQIFEATEVIYEAIDERILELVKATPIRCRYVILMGAILINGDVELGSFSQPRRFCVMDVASGEMKDYLQNPNE